MKFGPEPVAEAVGAILAHSMTVAGRRLKKGRALTAADVDALRASGAARVTVARLGPEDMGEDEAAAAIAAALAPDPGAAGLTASAPFTGRANLFAAGAGVLALDADAIAAANAVDEAVTIATLPDLARVAPRQMAATVKIIPYAAPRAAVEAAVAALTGAKGGAIALRRPLVSTASLVLTRTPGMKDSLLAKGADAVRDRLAGLGVALIEQVTTPHETGAAAAALAATTGEIALILTGSATSDRADVGPQALIAAGGALERYGMPVDPGNLLFLGSLAGRAVIGLPGCARSPALNGADWVLERVICGVAIGAAEIAAMGVGGLLKEIPSRPAPRVGGAQAPARPVVSGVLLAAGASRRMRGADKLLEEIDGAPLLRRSAEALLASGLDDVVAVLGPEDDARRAALAGLGLAIAVNPAPGEGMASSIRAGLTAIRRDADAVVIALADMPEIGPAHVDRLIAAFDPAEGRAIVRAAAENGREGNPALFGRRFFESLARLSGDQGARAVIADHPDLTVAAPTPGRAALVDLDTPEAWADWRANRGGAES